MAIKLKGTIKRTIRLHSVHSPVLVTLTDEGITMCMPKTKKKLTASWEVIARSMQTPIDVPSYIAGKPLEFLQWQQKKLQEKGAVHEGAD